MGKQWKQCQTLFFWAPKSLQMVTAAMKLKMLTPWKKSYDQPRQHIEKCTGSTPQSESLQPQGLQPARLFCSWNFPDKILEWVDSSFSRKSSDPGIKSASSACQADSKLSHLGSVHVRFYLKSVVF